MGDVPVPDVMDSSGRMKRLIIGLIAGATAAAIAYFISDSMAKPAPGPSVSAYSHGAYKFVYYMTALAGGAIFIITTVVLEARAKKQWKREQEIASARVVKK